MAIRRVRKFHPGTELALDRYLLSRLKIVGSIFGITNILFLLGSLWYVFFLLPQSAAEQARVFASEQIRLQLDGTRAQMVDQTRELTRTAVGLLNDVSVKAGESGVRLAQLSRDNEAAVQETKEVATKAKESANEVEKINLQVKSLQLALPQLQASFAGLEEHDVVKAKKFVQEVSEIGNVPALTAQLQEHARTLEAKVREIAALDAVVKNHAKLIQATSDALTATKTELRVAINESEQRKTALVSKSLWTDRLKKLQSRQAELAEQAQGLEKSVGKSSDAVILKRAEEIGAEMTQVQTEIELLLKVPE